MKKLFFSFLMGCAISSLHAQHFSLIRDINPGTASSNISYITRLDRQIFFGANNGTNGLELWKSDGTSQGTVMVKDINEGSGSSSIGYLTAVGNLIYFVANNGKNGVELWKSDGTAAGTVMVKDIRSGSASSLPSALVALENKLLFAASDGFNGSELWVSDGTAEGTYMLKNIHSTGNASPQNMVNMNGYVYFSADDGVNGRELWKSDGTTAGTTIVKDIYPGSNGSSPGNLVNIGSTIYFAATNNTNGTELWKTDGTSAGTVMVKDIWAGNNEGYPYNLRNVGGTLYFSATNEANGTELWKSDGTAAGTVLVKDIWPGSPSGTSGSFAGLINQLVFTGNDGVSGDKNWQSDGTTQGTRISGITVDASEGTIREIVETDEVIFVSVQDNSMGRELYGLRYSVVLPLEFLSFEGRYVQSDAQLIWKTSQEENADNFIIERSFNGRDFVAVGKLNASNTPGTHRYEFFDAQAMSLKAPVLFYRIRQNDQFGRYAYSAVISLHQRTIATVSIFPNPATDKVTLSGNFQQIASVDYQIFDNTGKLLKQVVKAPVSGNQLEILLSTFGTGVYYIRLQHERFPESFRLVKR